VLRLSTRAGEVLDLEPTPNELGTVAIETASSAPGADGTCVQTRFAVPLAAGVAAPAGAPRHIRHADQCPAAARRDFRARMKPCPVARCGRWVHRDFDLCTPHWNLVTPTLKVDIVDLRNEIKRGETALQYRHRRAVLLAAAEVAAQEATEQSPQADLLRGATA
jgi:hypothetical protein